MGCFCKWMSTWVMKQFGRVMVVGFYLIVLTMCYGFMFDINLVLYLGYKSRVLTLVLTSVANWLALNVVFNFTLAMKLTPGTTTLLATYYPAQLDSIE